MGLSMKLVFTLIIPLCPCFAVKVSKACYGIPGACTHHNLSCSSRRISITKAFYMDSGVCGIYGVIDCASVNLSSMDLTGPKHKFNETELNSLYRDCSAQPKCSLRAGRRRTATFSAITYQCIKETIDMCNVTNIDKADTSLIWRGSRNQNTCVCSISKPTNSLTVMTLRALDLLHSCHLLTLSGVGIADQCSNSSSNHLLYNFTKWRDVIMTVNNTKSNNNSVVWIGIKATDNVSIVCNENLTSDSTTSFGPARTKVSTTTAEQGTNRTLTSPTPSRPFSVVPPDETSKQKIGTETDASTSPIPTNATLHKDAVSGTGTVVGIIVPLCIIIAGVATAVIIVRRRKLRQKGENSKVVKPESNPVYSLKKMFTPENDYATNNDLVPQTHKMRSPQCGDADDDHYHQVEPLQTKAELTKSNHFSGNKNNKLNLQFSVRDCSDANYHELEPQTELGSSEYKLASTIDSHNGKSQPGNKGSSEYVLAENISKRGTESQQAMKGSSDYDYTGDNTYHVLERQSALSDSSDEAYEGGNDYHEVEPQDSNTSDYDYATCGDKQVNHSSSRNTQTRHSDYDHFGCQPARANGHYDTTLSVDGPLEGGNDKEEVYSYNHLNERTSSNADFDSTYNTTASTRHNLDASSNDMEDDYGYNHLGTDSEKNLPQNEYDTTASAIRDFARMNGDMEDATYNHAHLFTSDSSPSGMTNAGFQESDYDHTSPTATAHKDEYEPNALPKRSHQEEGVADVYTLAGEADTNPYRLAK